MRGPRNVPKGITIILWNHLNGNCYNKTLRSKECTKRHHNHFLGSFGHYCELPFGNVDSSVFGGMVTARIRVYSPFTVNGLQSD